MNELRIATRPQTAMVISSYQVVIFCLVTLVISTGLILLPLPMLVAPMFVVFVPTWVAMGLIILTEGWSQVRPRLFSREMWRLNLKWTLISLGLAVMLRLGVGLLTLLTGYVWEIGLFSPFLVIAFLFAAGEELGWRGFALPKMLEKGWSPLAAALLLGILWALLHVPLTLPGKLSAGSPALAQMIIMMSMSILTTWLYLGMGKGIMAATLFHGGQNLLSFVNSGLEPVPLTWLMAAVYLLAAILVIVLTRGQLGLKNSGRHGNLAQ